MTSAAAFVEAGCNCVFFFLISYMFILRIEAVCVCLMKDSLGKQTFSKKRKKLSCE